MAIFCRWINCEKEHRCLGTPRLVLFSPVVPCDNSPSVIRVDYIGFYGNQSEKCFNCRCVLHMGGKCMGREWGPCVTG